MEKPSPKKVRPGPKPLPAEVLTERQQRRLVERKEDGAAFRAEREAAGLTRAAVADACGVGESTVRAWETGRAGVPPSARKFVENTISQKKNGEA